MKQLSVNKIYFLDIKTRENLLFAQGDKLAFLKASGKIEAAFAPEARTVIENMNEQIIEFKFGLFK